LRIVGEDHHYQWLEGVVKATIVLNVLDACLTMYWISIGAATEANPILDYALQHGVWAFAVVKMSLVTVGTYLLWRFRERHTAVIGIFVAFAAYYFILLYHLQAMNLNLLERLFG